MGWLDDAFFEVGEEDFKKNHHIQGTYRYLQLWCNITGSKKVTSHQEKTRSGTMTWSDYASRHSVHLAAKGTWERGSTPTR